MPDTMQAALLLGHGGPELLVVRDDVPVPVPGAGEVRIKVGAAGVNNTDIWTREGAYNLDPDADEAVGWMGDALGFPRIQGIDAMGVIDAVGDGVDPSRVGERVLVDLVMRPPAGEPDGIFGAPMLGSELDGGFAEFCVVPAGNAVSIRSELSDAELASFPCAYLTGLHMLERARVVADEWVVVPGASGGVGSALVQIAKARGARVCAIVAVGKEDQARALGADAVVTRRIEGLGDAIRAAIGGETDVVADTVGGPMFPEVLGAIRPHGRYVVAGGIAGPHVDLDLRVVYLRHLDVIGATCGLAAEFRQLVELIETGRVRPVVAATYPLSEIGRAQADFLEKRHFGKLVLIPGS